MKRVLGVGLSVLTRTAGGVCTVSTSTGGADAASAPGVSRCSAPCAGAIDIPCRQLFSVCAPLRAAPKGSAQYQCGECGKNFRLLNALNHHIMTKHGGKAKALVSKDGELEEVAAASTAGASPETGGSAASQSVAGAKNPLPSAGSLFPGMFAAPFGAPLDTMRTNAADGSAAAAAAAGEGVTAESGAAPVSDDVDKRLFVCTVCQKTFRLEAALQHHYQAKHNMEMPQSGAGSVGGAGGTSSPVSSSPSADEEAGTARVDATQAPLNATQYVQQQEGALPQAPEYHLDVAPNAPEEGDVAAHWRCVNTCVLLGSVTDVQEGYVFEDHVLQFTLVTAFEGPAPGDPDKDFHTVRVYDERYWGPIRDQLREGAQCCVTGRLRMVPQFDTSLKKYYHFPVVQVFPGTGSVLQV